MGFIKRVGSLPGIAIVLTAIVAAYMTLVAFTNITDFDTNQQFVRGVFEMDTTFGDDDVMWRSIQSDTLADIGYVGVIIWETVAAIVLWWGVIALVRAYGAGQWTTARRIASTGLLMVLILFGFGFITVGGEWFVMWQSGQWNGLNAALRNFILAAFVLVLVNLPSPDWADDAAAADHGQSDQEMATPG
jgi:predicted small integral membrane protein